MGEYEICLALIFALFKNHCSPDLYIDNPAHHSITQAKVKVKGAPSPG